MQVLYLGRALRTKETLPDFLKWRWVTRHPLVFRGLTGSQTDPRVLGRHINYVAEFYPNLRILIKPLFQTNKTSKFRKQKQ